MKTSAKTSPPAPGSVPLTPGLFPSRPSQANLWINTSFLNAERHSHADILPFDGHGWLLLLNGDLSVHPVGQKLPNPWGLSDIYGNVWEWCQDWYGDQTGGVQTDPTGPASNPVGNKVMRGGAYD